MKGKQIWQSTCNQSMENLEKKVFGSVGNNIEQLMTKILIWIGNLTLLVKEILGKYVEE